jgi:hypothetical protein
MSEQIPPDMTNHPSACDVLYVMACEAILDNARRRLLRSPYPQLWKVTFEFFEGVLTLHGVVDSYFLKQLAHVAVVDVLDIYEVINQLHVRYPVNKSNDRDN